MNRRHLLLSQVPHIIDFDIDCNWLNCFGHRLFDSSWEILFTVWVKSLPRQDIAFPECLLCRTDGVEEMIRRNPTDALRLRLAEEGLPTTFLGDEYVHSLLLRVANVNLAELMDAMKMISVASSEEYSVPIVLLD